MAYTPKKVYVNGNPVLIAQASLKVKFGYGETNVRAQVFGRTTTPVASENLETKISEISFDLLAQDSTDDSDLRVLIKSWKDNIGANIITIEPDGAGQTQIAKNMSLTNDPEVNETPDGVISLVWQGSPVTLTN